ncbi:hypothetical protein SAMN06273570_0485 [Candidatus Pantoea floridensis]|uniref:Uncharacterized protein n=1 Tax=Candidatus Pantoea floridensis TaxID=1938870 RepID=A0A286BNX5_9GAMM|nr:hypothetical protein BX596_2162 [Enterobacteriaceae bacterium JKS000233]SOD35859.1 hypothetical protein SAMN06273570_0485 [Pantoea floridensis]
MSSAFFIYLIHFILHIAAALAADARPCRLLLQAPGDSPTLTRIILCISSTRSVDYALCFRRRGSAQVPASGIMPAVFSSTA